MTRNGKIARLPRGLRNQLNQRLDDGEPGPQVLAWLNEHPVVREILERNFGGRAISEQNLSEWRHGGLRDWQRQQEACDHVRRLTDQSEAVEEAADETNVSDRLAKVLAVELFKVMEQLLEKSGDDEEKRLSYLREGLREVRLLRRGDHNAMRLQIELQRWEREWEQQDEDSGERLKEASRKRRLGLLLSKTDEGNMAEIFGGGEQGRKMADMITRINFDLPLPKRPKTGETKSPPAGTTTTPGHEEAERMEAPGRSQNGPPPV